MSAFAETLSEKERRRARRFAYLACYFGCISEVMLDSSAIVILYLGMLGAGNSLTMLTSSFTGLLCMLTMIPCAHVIDRLGLRKSITLACLTGCTGFVLMGAAPFFGSMRLCAAITGCFLYCLQRALYGVAWYPLLDAFLRTEERGSFFGTMRWTYMVISGTIFYFFGKLMGAEPPIWIMQVMIASAGLLVLGRLFCILQFPEDKGERPRRKEFREALSLAVHNGPLTAYSVYVCFFYLATASLIPLTLLYLKNYIKLPAGSVQVFSTVGIAGRVIAFFLYGFLLRRLKIKRMEFLVHAMTILALFTLFAVPKDFSGFLVFIGAAFFLYSFASSCYMCNNSSEILSLASPGNKPMATAFVQTYQSIGGFLSLSGGALVIGSGLLSSTWEIGGIVFSNYQTLFLFGGVLGLLILILLPTLPAVVPHHQDYYEEMH